MLTLLVSAFKRPSGDFYEGTLQITNQGRNYVHRWILYNEAAVERHVSPDGATNGAGTVIEVRRHLLIVRFINFLPICESYVITFS